MDGIGGNEAYTVNLKRIVDEWAALAQHKASAQATVQDQLNALFLQWAGDQHTLVMRTADTNAVLLSRMAGNAATVDHLGDLDALTPPAETTQAAIGAKVAEEVSSTAKDALKSALGSTALTSAAAEGSTGVAQAGLQTQVAPELAQTILNANTVQMALLGELAKIEQALSVILVKVTGDASAA